MVAGRGPRKVREDAARRLGPHRRVTPALEASSSGPDTGAETGHRSAPGPYS